MFYVGKRYDGVRNACPFGNIAHNQGQIHRYITEILSPPPPRAIQLIVMPIKTLFCHEVLTTYQFNLSIGSDPHKQV